MIKIKLNIIFFIFFIIAFTALFFIEGPLKLKNSNSTLSDLIPRDILLDDIWYGVYLKDNFIGFSHFYLRVQDASEGGGYLLSNSTNIKLPVLNTTQKIAIDSDLILHKNYKLKQATLRFNSQQYSLKGIITQEKGSAYNLKVQTPTQEYQKSITLKDEYVTSLLAPFSLSYLPKSKNASLILYDPFFDRKVKVIFRDLGKEIIQSGGREFEASIVEMELDGIKGKLYLDQKRRIIRKDIFEFSFIKEEPWSIFKKNDQAGSKDLASSFAIKTKPLPDIENLSYIKFKIKGIDLKDIPQDHTQKVTIENNIVYLEVYKRQPKQPINIPINDSKYSDYLKESDYIKTKDPIIVNTVSSIIENETNALSIVKKLSSWIDENIEKVPTMSIPNTLDVMQMRQGDCGELSALLVGFLRSLGIPAYTNIGIVYMDSHFYYHAWVSVYVGQWIDTDIAMNQFIADPTHIKLFKGLENQYKLAKIINRLNIEVLEYE